MCKGVSVSIRPRRPGAALRLLIYAGAGISGTYKQKQGRWYNHPYSYLLASGQAATASHSKNPQPLLRDDAEAC